MTDIRLLVRGVNWLGDAVMTTPALQRLRQALPGAHITLLTHQKLGDLWKNHPSIDQIMTFETGESPWSIGRRLRAERFNTALVLPNSPRSALEVRLAGIPERVGYARPWRNWFLTKPIPPRPGRVEMHKLTDQEVKALVEAPTGRGVALRRPRPRPAGGMNVEDARIAEGNPPPDTTLAHQMHEYLHLAAALGANPAPVAPKLVITPDELQQAEHSWLSRLRAQQTDSGNREPMILFGLNPGAEYGPAKRWPAENFAAAAREISQKIKNSIWLVFGGANDRELAERVTSLAGGNTFNLAGKTSLREFMALLKRCRVLLTNDTGPMHIAAALGTPVIVPFGSTSPELTGPGLPGDPRNNLLTGTAPCSPCFRRECPIDFRCMKSITVESVAEGILEALRPKGVRP